MTANLHQLADANLIEAIREHARWQEDAVCVEQDGLLLMAGGNATPIAFRNCAARLDPRLSAEEALAHARAFFARFRRGFTLMLRASVDADLAAQAAAAGLLPRGESPCMLIDTPLTEPLLPPGVRIARFDSERQVRDAVRINAEAYQSMKLPAAEAEGYFSRPSALLTPRVHGFVAYRGDEPVSTALTIVSGESAGVYWVGTVAAARGAGLAEACTRLATNAGFAAGARAVTLQASPFGEPIYRRLGYRVYDTYMSFMQLPPKAGAA